MLTDIAELGGTHVLIEAPYIDFDYRSEYSHLYARIFNPPPNKCERLLFFADDRFLGFSVMRPSHKPVGRTAFVPPPKAQSLACCLAPHHVRPGGEHLNVEAYPFMSQDGQYGRCAHAAIWSVARYHHHRHGTGRHSIAGVVDAAGTREAVDRTSASGGLYLHQVAAAFHGLGLPTMIYDPKKDCGRTVEGLENGVDGAPNAGEGQVQVGKDDGRARRIADDIERVVCRYLDSGFPVVLNTDSHLTVLIGYGYQDNKVVFLRADDNYGPYEIVPQWRGCADRLGEWEMLLIPLPARIHVPGESAEIFAYKHMKKESGATKETLPFRQLLHDGELRMRTYAVEATEYKVALAGREPSLSDEVVEHHRSIPASAWIWVTEFQRKSKDFTLSAEVVGEIAMDATSHRSHPSPVFANMPGRCVAWLPDEALPRAKKVTDISGYGSAMPTRLVAE